MAINPTFARTTNLLTSDRLLASLRKTQAQLQQANDQLTSGKAFDRPSQAPDKLSGVVYLQQKLAQRDQQDTNLQLASGLLGNADQALGDAGDILNQANTIASSQIGVGSDTATRQTEANVIDAQIDGLLQIANRQSNNLSLFGGNHGAGPDGNVFKPFLGGVRYTGSAQNLQGDLGALNSQAITSNGVTAFGALSSRVESDVDLNVQAQAQTRLADLGGAQAQGVRQGTVQVTVDGTLTAVDLSTADTLGDVADRINPVLGSDGSVAVTGDRLQLTSGGASIQIADPADGQTAGDLGLGLSLSGAGSVSGEPLDPALTPTTKLADLAAPIDLTSGLTITQGQQTVTVDLSVAQTVQDVQNAIDKQNLGLKLEINEGKTGFNLVSEVSGVSLSVGENGGTTAQDLGITTLGRATALADFRHGLGVENIQGEDDFALTLRDGTSFNVNIDGLSTVGEVIDKIKGQATAAGVAVGGDFNVGLASTGNGITFTDTTAGSGSLTVADLGSSHAATHLGIEGNSGGTDTLVGTDNAKARVENVFTHLQDLRDSLLADDTSGITIAGTKLSDDHDKVVSAHAQVGVQAKRVADQQTRSQDLRTQEQAMLSQLQDTDFTAAITRFTQLQTQLQASLSVGAKNHQLSLLDFLR